MVIEETVHDDKQKTYCLSFTSGLIVIISNNLNLGYPKEWRELGYPKK